MLYQLPKAAGANHQQKCVLKQWKCTPWQLWRRDAQWEAISRAAHPLEKGRLPPPPAAGGCGPARGCGPCSLCPVLSCSSPLGVSLVAAPLQSLPPSSCRHLFSVCICQISLRLFLTRKIVLAFRAHLDNLNNLISKALV